MRRVFLFAAPLSRVSLYCGVCFRLWLVGIWAWTRWLVLVIMFVPGESQSVISNRSMAFPLLFYAFPSGMVLYWTMTRLPHPDHVLVINRSAEVDGAAAGGLRG